MIDFLLIGAGLYNAVLARELTKYGKKCLILEKRKHIGGNCYTENKHGITIHKYGPHIFHTNNEDIWKYVKGFAEFNNFVNRPKINVNGEIYSLPINLSTLYQLWGVKTPAEAKERLKNSKIPNSNIFNAEEYALAEFGADIYNHFIKNYTIKQWQRHPRDLPPEILKRLIIRTNFDDNYYKDKYQGVPIGGYTKMIENILKSVEVKLNVDYLSNREYWKSQSKNLVYSGKIDEFYNYCYGELEYRTQSFIEEELEIEDYQGCAVMNYADLNVPYTRIIEHKHFNLSAQNYTIITKEIPEKWNKSKIPLYPVNNSKNNTLFEKYKEISKNEKGVYFGGRLGDYKYYDMEHVIALAIKKGKELCQLTN